MHIFLIRHGESVANAGENYGRRVPDHLVPLTERGRREAYEAGVFLAEHCRRRGIDLSRARLWRSPFLRTRETADELNRSLSVAEVREDITLVEQQYGLFDALPPEAWAREYPREYAEYCRQMQNGGKFYARLPLGESPFDVAVRVHQFMGTLDRDLREHGVDTVFIVTHGATLRAFLLRWFHYTPEWYHGESNPENCAIREIDGGRDLGYIKGGPRE